MNRIISYSQMDGMVHGTGKPLILIQWMRPNKVNRKTLEKFSETGTVGEASGFVEYFQNVKELPVFMFRQYIVMGLLSLCQHLLEQLGLDMGRLPETVGYGKVLKDGCTLDMLKEKLVRLFEEVMT